MYSQEVYFPVDNKNNFQPKIIKTNDGGYLINSSYSSYTPNLTPFEGTFRFRLIKIDNNGNEQWSFLNDYFSPYRMFENSDGSLVSISGGYSGDWFNCQGISYQWGYKIFFTKVSSDGSLQNRFELNPGCENKLKSVLKVDENKYAVIATSYNGILESNPESHLFYFDNDGNIINEHSFINEEYESANLFKDNLGNICMVYIDGNTLFFNKYDSNLNLLSQINYPNFHSIFPDNSFLFKISTSQLQNDNISLFVKYFSWTEYNTTIITFNDQLEYLNHYDYIMPNSTNRLFNSNNEDFVIGYKSEDSLTSETHINLNHFDENGLLVYTQTIDFGNDFERPSTLAYDYSGNYIILGDINCCNLDNAIGPAIPFISLNNRFLKVEENMFSVYPNPTMNILNIKSTTEIKQIQLFNKLGQMIIHAGEKNELDISNFNQGIYFIKIEDINGRVAVKRIIKK